MAEQPNINTDFAGWTAANWSQLVPDADATAAAVAIRFIRAADDLAQTHTKTIRPWKNHGIANIADFRILGLLRHIGEDGITSRRIAEHLSFEPATVSSRLMRLEKHGHIVRIDNPGNRRTHNVALNPSSAEIVDDIYRALVNNHQHFFQDLTAAEHRTLADLLLRLT